MPDQFKALQSLILTHETFDPVAFSEAAKDLSEAISKMANDRFSSTSIPHVMPRFPMTEELPKVDIAPKPEPIKKNLTGASFLANLIRTQHAAIKEQLSKAGTEMTDAINELQGIANEATNQVKAVKAETADLKAALGLNSNGEQE